jgi:PilZ domain
MDRSTSRVGVGGPILMSVENRNDGERQERNIPTKIFSLTGEPIMECVLRNISGRGARIVVAYFPEVVPDSFRLQIDKMRPKCRVKWRSGSELGVEFF